VLWRWRASNDAGKGTTTKVTVNGATQWGDDVTAIGTYLKDESRGLYNLYVTDPSEQQIRAYSPAADGSGFPAKATGWLAASRAVDKMTSMYIDGDLFITENGVLERLTSGRNDGWEATSPGDEQLRPSIDATLVAGAGPRREGNIYAFDADNGRVIAWEKDGGRYVAQYRVAGDPDALEDLRALYVLPPVGDGPATLVWLSKSAVHKSLLEPVSATPSASPSGPPASAAPGASAKPTAKP
jgi:hypothetical protein